MMYVLMLWPLLHHNVITLIFEERNESNCTDITAQEHIFVKTRVIGVNPWGYILMIRQLREIYIIQAK